MLKHRVGNIALKSETLPRFEGQDEEGEALLESAFDLMQITNSCPDLSIIVDTNEETHESHRNHNHHYRDNVNIYVAEHSYPSSHLTVRTEDHADGRYFGVSKIPLGFRRSTSLNSLEADGSGDCIASNSGAKTSGNLEHHDHRIQHQNPGEFARTAQRSSYNGPPTGYLQKSISTPSVTQGRPLTEEQLRHLNQCYATNHHIIGQQQIATGSQNSSKRSFFRRKHKSKNGVLNSHPPVVVQQYKRNSASGLMMTSGSNSSLYTNGAVSNAQEVTQESSFGYSALIDPSLGLQDPDVECWTLFMNSEVVSQLNDKEIKRQEHMYEFILTEKHHCLTLALMNHLFVFGMRTNGYSREASLLFPGLHELLQVHVSFFRKLREKQNKFRDLDRPLDTLSDLLLEQFTADSLGHMVRLYGLLCSSHEKSLDLFKNLKLKDQKFASLVASWNKESKLGRKNVPECLLLVAQRITKYPLLIEPLLKTSSVSAERDHLLNTLLCSKELNSKVNELVAERQRLLELCQRIDSKSVLVDGPRRIRREDLVYVPSRRLRFHGQAIVNLNRVISGGGGAMPAIGGGIPSKTISCHIFVLTDCLLLMHEVNGKLVFVTPPGFVKLSTMMVREKAGSHSTLFLVLGSGTPQPEIIELQVLHPHSRDEWIKVIRDAKSSFDLEWECSSDFEDDFSSDPTEMAEQKVNKVLEQLQEHDRQILTLLKSRTKVIQSLNAEKQHSWRPNNFEGKDEILNAIGVASDEVQKVMKSFDDGSTTTVNRSQSCASEHVSAYGATGLPRRADTFGGFDSQQRSSIELSQSQHNKVLLQMVVQLSDVCGELFHQMLPNLALNIQEANQYYTKRMEEIRAYELKVANDRASARQEFERLSNEAAKEKAEISAARDQLNTDQADVSHQREQLYRKLEKLESKGIGPYLNSVSPVTVNTSEKATANNVSARRSPSQAPSVVSSGGANNKLPPKQQLPLHLAAFSSSKAGAGNNLTNSNDKSKLQHAGSFQGAPPLVSSQSAGEITGLTRNNSTAQMSTSRMSPRSNGPSGTPQSASVQQMLPLRLSEGNSNNKSSTLPRGNGSQTNLTGIGQPNEGQSTPMPHNINNNNGYARMRSSNPNHFLQHSKSSASILTRNPSGESSMPYAHGGPNTDRMSNYYRDAHVANQSNNGHGQGAEYGAFMNTHNPNAVPVVHRRSGSSPVPMSSAANFQTSYQQQKGGSSDDDDDSNKIMFL